MVNNNYINVRLTRKTVGKLRYMGRKGQTYDEIILGLIENQKEAV